MDKAHRTALRERSSTQANRDLLRTGWAPSIAAAESLRGMAIDLQQCSLHIDSELHQLQVEVRRLEETVRRLQRQMVALSEEKTCLEDQASLCQAITSPIRRLPTEIMVDIFTLVLDNRGLIGDDLHSLSTTCCAWRTVALTTPRLWSTINIGSGGFLLHDQRRIDALVRVQLQRSADRPIDLEIVVDNGSHYEALASSSEAWRSVCTQSHRWKTVAFQFLGSCSTFWRNQAPLPLPMLETIRLTGTPVSPLVVFLDAPKLRFCHIRPTFSPRPENLAWPSQWRSLSRLALLGVPVMDCISALRSYQSTLKTISIDVEEPEFADEQNWSSLGFVELLALEDLRVSDSACRYVCPLLVIPAVWALVIDHLDADLSSYNVLHMVDRSSATITYLSITTGNAAEGAVLDLLRALPSITRLHLDAENNRSVLTERFFRGITPSDDNTDCPLPSLRHLSALVSCAQDPGDISLSALMSIFDNVRREDHVVAGQLYPALEERSLTRRQGDDLFKDPDSDAEDEEYIPSSVPSEDDTDTNYSTDVSENE
ncbi:hypothetical protein BD626DRAFT_472855 [Schizophyllum amplum]|uniref:F-box domain-containing protein n=1 Tax=Schizophyllum amplum TaxID=97359 RepID=A0A550CWA9_9AGAR|nr:hypothetical protein BD626DRAFT_472855 [Auriculariopsis ampla]